MVITDVYLHFIAKQKIRACLEVEPRASHTHVQQAFFVANQYSKIQKLIIWLFMHLYAHRLLLLYSYIAMCIYSYNNMV